MYLLTALLFFYFVTITTCESDKVLLKFKSDVDKVGHDFENLVFDIVKKVVDDVGVYQDYYASDEVSTQHSVTKKILNDIENTTEEYNTEKTVLKNAIQYEEVVHNRLERSIKENSSISLNQSEETKPVTELPIINDTCTQNGQVLETHQMHDLKEEIKKLQDLVILLKDQQKIISVLDKNSKMLNSDIASRFGARDVLKLLDYVNTKDIQEQKDRHSTAGNSDLLNIKNDLKEAIATLNKTRHILTMERKKELLLEKELTDQKLDISFLKMMMQKLYTHNNDNAGSDILGATRHLPKDLPDHRLVKAIGDSSNIRGTSEDDEPKPMLQNRARTSDLDNLESLVRELNQPKKTNIESRILDLQRELDKKKQDEDALKQLKLLEKYLEHRKKEQSTDSESEMARKFQLAMKTMDEGKGRALDDEIELELEKLQEAIDNLRPNDDQESTNAVPSSSDDMKEFQMMLKKMFGRQNRRKESDGKRFQMYNREDKTDEDPVKQFQSMLDKMVNQGAKSNVNSPVNHEQNVLLREIIELRKQLAASGRPQFGSGYSYVPPDFYGQTPHQMELNRPNYPPYMNPGYQNVRNKYFNSGDNKQHYTNHVSSPDYPRPISSDPNFLPTYFKSVPQEYKKTHEEAWNQNKYDSEQNPYQTSLGPNNFNMGPSRYQNNPEFKDFGANMPPYRYTSETNADFQPLAELHEIPFTISVLPPNQKALNLEANTIDNIYKSGQNTFQQDRNQFFPMSLTKSAPEFVQSPEAPAGSSTGQPGVYTPKTAGNVGHVYQRVDDLKAQIYNLQSIIDGLNKPNYTQTLQDKETIIGLERQINDLKEMINNMDQEAPQNYTPRSPNDDHKHVSGKARPKRSIENNEDVQLYDQVASGLKKLIFEKENKFGERSSYDDLQSRIDDLRYQLESRTHSKEGSTSPILSLNTYQPPYYQRNHLSYTPARMHQFELTTPKKNDVFTALVVKILDKLIASTPAVLERLFGQGLTELSNFGNVGDGGQNEIQNLFKSLGFFGYGPLIFLRLIDGFTTFMKILRKNDFFKNFLTPAFILLLVSGAVVFLVWWLQPDGDAKPQPDGYYYKYNDSYSNYNYHSKGYGNNRNNYGYKGSYRPPAYSGNYLDDGKQSSRFI